MTGTGSFKDVVASEVHNNATPEQIAELRSQPRKWLAELNSLSRDMEIQLSSSAARRHEGRLAWARDEITEAAYLAIEAEEARWKIKALRFKASIEDKIQEVKLLRSEARV